MPSSESSPASFCLERYRAHEEAVALLMSNFFLGYLKDLHREFSGDLAMVIVLAEIAHHSSSAFYTPGTGSTPDIRPSESGALPSCSAYSLAAATGLPRETVRRNISRLTELGWVKKTGWAEARITEKAAEHFTPDFNIRLL